MTEIGRLLRGIVGMGKPRPQTNSQYGEDVFLRRFFAFSPPGTWLDVGAFHPRVASNTAQLRRQGWTGINVDADPVKVRLFRWFRRSDINICAAVAGKDTGRAVLERKGSYGSMDRLKRTDDPRGVQTRTIAEILEEIAPEKIDFVSIDVEGLEGEIIASYPFDQYPAELFCIEVLDTTLDGVCKSDIAQVFEERGYQIVGWFPPSVFFGRRTLPLGKID
jgi:FkbM family methyltransferase